VPYKIKIPHKPVEIGEVAALHWLDRWAAWEVKRRRVLWPIIGIVMVFVVVGGGAGGWWWWQNRQAAILAGQAATFYPVPSESGDNTSPDGKKPALESRCKDALPLYQQMTARYGGSRLTPLALYYQADCQIELGHPEEAIGLYRQVLARYPAAHEIVAFSATRLGYLYAREGDRSKAIDQFTWLTEQPKAFHQDQAYYELGRLDEADGKKDAALAAYQAVVKGFPKSPWTAEAKVRIKELGGQTGEELPQQPKTEATPPATLPQVPAGQTPPTEKTAK
jgi:tetratricopeptide (TPR) repeat protein